MKQEQGSEPLIAVLTHPLSVVLKPWIHKCEELLTISSSFCQYQVITAEYMHIAQYLGLIEALLHEGLVDAGGRGARILDRR